MKKRPAMGPLAQWMLLSSSILVAMFSAPSVSNAQPQCSNATLEGGYGFFAQAIILPAPNAPPATGTPRSILGRINFDGRGNFTNTLTFNDNGTVTQHTDSGTYIVNADCTGTIFTNGSSGPTIEIVIVDGGKEFYQLRTNPPTTLFLFNAAKKQLPGENQ